MQAVEKPEICSYMIPDQYVQYPSHHLYVVHHGLHIIATTLSDP